MKKKLIIALCVLFFLTILGPIPVGYYYVRNKVLAHHSHGLIKADDNITVNWFRWWPRAMQLGIYLANPGGAIHMPPNYTETLAADLVLKAETWLAFDGPCRITQGSFRVTEPSGNNNTIVTSPFVHSSNQAGSNLGCTFSGYTGTAGAFDLGDSSGFLNNIRIAGINVSLASAGANATAFRMTNVEQSAFDDIGCIQGPVSGHACYRSIGTGAFFAGLNRIMSIDCEAPLLATNNKCIELGAISNDFTIIGGHANILGSGANGSVCIDVSGAASAHNKVFGFDCDTGVTAVTVESTTSGGIVAYMDVDSGVTNAANFGAGSFGNVVYLDANLPFTDSGTAGTNSVINYARNNFRTDIWQNQVQATFSFFFKDLLDSGNDRLTLVNGVAGDTRLNAGSGAGLIKLAWEQGTGGTDFGNGAGATSGASVTSGGIIQSKNTVRVASDFTTANNTSLQTITGLTWAFPAVAKNYSFHCALAYSQATAAVSDAFGIQAATNAPTNIFATGEVQTAATTQTGNTLATLATTTATNIVTFTPSATASIFFAQIDGTFELGASANTVNIMVSTSAGADAVTIKRGSYCQVF